MNAWRFPFRNATSRMLRDPLAHFLLLGAVLFAAYGFLGSDRGEAKITVSHDTLLNFIQYRSKIFDPAMAEARLSAMPSAELKQVVDDYIAEEALYREAEALGLDKQDYVIKRRMVQKMEFIGSGFAEADKDIDEEELRAYYREHSYRFAAPLSYTFTHVFIPRDEPSPGALDAAAKRVKQDLIARKAGFADAPRFGQRFPYGVNFVEVTPEQIESQFGQDFLRQLSMLTPAKGRWQGPLHSEFGSHVVMLVAKKKPELPPFEKVRDKVEAEYARLLADRQRDEAIARIVARYPVEMEFMDPRLGTP